jgi:hypothetical protein
MSDMVTMSKNPAAYPADSKLPHITFSPLLRAKLVALSDGSIPNASQPAFFANLRKSPLPHPTSKILPGLPNSLMILTPRR